MHACGHTAYGHRPASWRGQMRAYRGRDRVRRWRLPAAASLAVAAATLVASLALLLAASWAQDVARRQVRLSWATCRALVEHVPSPDVKYRPGTDQAGRKVAPADLKPRPNIKIPETITIPITVDLCQRYSSTENVKLCHTPFAKDGVTARPFDTHVPPPPGRTQPYDVEGPRQRYEASAYIGTVTVKGDGRRAYLDGEPLTDTEQALMREACMREYKRMR